MNSRVVNNPWKDESYFDPFRNRLNETENETPLDKLSSTNNNFF